MEAKARRKRSLCSRPIIWSFGYLSFFLEKILTLCICIYTRNYSDGPEVPSAVSQTNHAGCCCCCCCSWASLIGNQIEGGKQKNLNSVNMQTSSKLLGPGAADPQIRFGGSDWHWKWLDRSVQSFSFSLSLPLSAFGLEQMMNMKRVKTTEKTPSLLHHLWCQCVRWVSGAAAAAERERAQTDTSLRYTNRKWWTGGSWRESFSLYRLFFRSFSSYLLFFCFVFPVDRRCVWHETGSFVTDDFSFSHLQRIAIKRSTRSFSFLLLFSSILFCFFGSVSVLFSYNRLGWNIKSTVCVGPVSLKPKWISFLKKHFK